MCTSKKYKINEYVLLQKAHGSVDSKVKLRTCHTGGHFFPPVK